MTAEELKEEIDLDWSRMKEGIDNIDEVFQQFKARLSDYLKAL